MFSSATSRSCARECRAKGSHVSFVYEADLTGYGLYRRNKTDRADGVGLLEADRCGDIRAVPVNTPDQQGIQGLHRIGEHQKAQRTAAINLVRGLLREFGIAIAAGADKVRPAVLAALEGGDNDLPIARRRSPKRTNR